MCILLLLVGVTPIEFCRNLWHQKLDSLGYVVCMILRLAVLVQCRLVTDRWTDGRRARQTDRHTHDNSIYRASIASRSKKMAKTDNTNLFCLAFSLPCANFSLLMLCTIEYRDSVYNYCQTEKHELVA